MGELARQESQNQTDMNKSRDLYASQEEFGCLIDSMELAFFHFDADWHILESNHKACELLGYSPAELLALPATDIDVEIQSRISAGLANHLKNNRKVVAETLFRRKDGSMFPVSIKYAGFTSNESQHYIATARDMTETRHIEELYLHAQKLGSTGRLSRGVAHDFNNILTAIQSYTHLGMMGLAVDSELYKYFNIISKAADRATELTRRLLVFSNRPSFNTGVMDLNETILEMQELLHRAVGEDIKLVVLPAKQLGSVRCDPGQIEHVLVNLALRARDSLSSGGSITIRTYNTVVSTQQTYDEVILVPGRYAVLEISSDQNDHRQEGLDANKGKVFPAEDACSDNDMDIGTSQHILKLFGGSLISSDHHGSIVEYSVYLPTLEDMRISGAEKTPSTEVPGGNETILVVEDDPAARQAIVSVLETLGYTVEQAENSEMALKISLSKDVGRIDLLLTDIVMPGMGGKELAKIFRERHTSAKVLFTSGYSDETTLGRSLQTIDASFLPKPFTPVILGQSVRKALDK